MFQGFTLIILIVESGRVGFVWPAIQQQCFCSKVSKLSLIFLISFVFDSSYCHTVIRHMREHTHTHILTFTQPHSRTIYLPLSHTRTHTLTHPYVLKISLQTFSKTLPEKKKLAQQTFFKIESTKNSSEKNFLKSKTLLVTVLKLD